MKIANEYETEKALCEGQGRRPRTVAIHRRNCTTISCMNRAFYRAGKAIGLFLFFCTIRTNRLRPELANRPGGYLLALSHQAHLDPFCACVLVRRPIRWMARKEFFRYRPCAWLLKKFGAFSVNRAGIPVTSIRTAIGHARSGAVVGLCPEGEVTSGVNSVMRGAKIKKGVCSVAIRAAVPIVPCIILGAPEMSRIIPWFLPSRIDLWIGYGQPIHPPGGKSTRAKRNALAEQLAQSYVALYAEMLGHFRLDDSQFP